MCWPSVIGIVLPMEASHIKNSLLVQGPSRFQARSTVRDMETSKQAKRYISPLKFRSQQRVRDHVHMNYSPEKSGAGTSWLIDGCVSDFKELTTLEIVHI